MIGSSIAPEAGEVRLFPIAHRQAVFWKSDTKTGECLSWYKAV